MIVELEAMIERFKESGKFLPVEISVDSASRTQVVKLRSNPDKFVPGLFNGDWAELAAHPELGTARVLRILEGSDGVTRAILRQGRSLFVYPFV